MALEADGRLLYNFFKKEELKWVDVLLSSIYFAIR